jgi:acyl-CoA synthetase (AMP-forming)/AMP-acid ligase II
MIEDGNYLVQSSEAARGAHRTTGSPQGAVYDHRGAYLNALGEVIETRMTSESVFLWTLPMFHCNARQQLPRYMRLDALELTTLTRTATGKIEKRALRDREWAGRERKIG